VRFRSACLVVLAALVPAGAARARTVTDTAGFIAGPRAVAGGLLWGGVDGVSVAGGGGGSRLLVPGVRLSGVTGDADWIAVAGRSGVRAGRLGGPLGWVAALHRCSPLESPARLGPRVPLFALTGPDLYVVISTRCAGDRRGGRPVLARVALPDGRARVLARIASGVVSLAATGTRLAVTYGGSPGGSQRVEVLNATDGGSLFSVRAPAGMPDPEPTTTQIDSRGDVLVTGPFFIPPGAVAVAWWGDQHIRVGHVLDGLEVGSAPEPWQTRYWAPLVAASLSNGELAYATYPRVHGERIVVRNLLTDTTRTVARFPGSADVLGVALRGTRLAWAQQSLGFTTPTKTDECVTQTHALGPVQLVTANAEQARPITEPGAAVAPPLGPMCPAPS